jgi:hypothetical protein
VRHWAENFRMTRNESGFYALRLFWSINVYLTAATLCIYFAAIPLKVVKCMAKAWPVGLPAAAQVPAKPPVSRPRSRDSGSGAWLASLAGRWLTDKQNVLLTGPTGAGKTWLACALAHQAYRQVL